jgi:hypothetical protein
MIDSTTMALAAIQGDLKVPFDPAEVDFLPKGSFERDGQTKAAGMPFVNKRAYEDRLNAACPGDWSSQAQVVVAGNKLIIVTTITICGISRADVGESALTGMQRGEIKDEENTATEAFAQSFKRACSQFGLGRYLYDLPKVYLPYNKQKRCWDISDAEIRKTAVECYRKAGLRIAEPERAKAAPASQRAAPAASPAAPAHQSQPLIEQPVPGPDEPAPDSPVTQQQLAEIFSLCKDLKKQVGRPATFADADKLIVDLRKELRVRRHAS